tara:strand:- start:3653 stop:4456 length:804 start_codon:yes stop_codon:yes gene_type:complete
MESLRMNNLAVNLGAGGFVSYFENGGATVVLEGGQEAFEEPDYAERGVGSFLADQVMSVVSDEEGFPADEIRQSGRTNAVNRDEYYPEGQTFFETLAEDYDYPVDRLEDGSMGIAPLSGKNRMGVPRSDLPKAQELEDARGHMLASAMAATRYGPETAMSIGNLNEYKDVVTPFGNSQHSAMDTRNNAVGISLFKKAGIGASTAQLTQMVDKRIFDQLNIILGRSPEEREAPAGKPKWRKNFRSPEEGPDVYFPREKSGYFVKDHKF